MGAALKPLADASTLLLTYAQVISPTSHPYLPYISPISPPYLPCISTLLLTYAQVISSLLVALPRVEWPEPFASIARVLGVFALDLTPLFSLDAVGEGVGDAMHAAAVTVLLSAEPSP